MRPQTVGLIAHTGKPGSPALVRAVQEEFSRASVRVLVESATAALVGDRTTHSIPDLARDSELLVVLGGDGTILNVVGQLGDQMKPVFGINVGSLGFLTCAASAEYAEAVRCIVQGEMVFSHRTLLDVTVTSEAGEITVTGLNDAVLSRGEVSRLIRLQTSVNGEALTEFNADGLIVATPTGSTAYSLSAGGPILAPESGALVITPICPHVLTMRPVIVSDDSMIEIMPAQHESDVFLTLDGQRSVRVENGDVVRITKAPQRLALAMLPGMSFFEVLRQKLKWSGTAV